MIKTGTWLAIAAAVIAGREAKAETPLPPTPKDFAMAASQNDQYEIVAANVALVEGQDPRVRKFAQKMIDEHTRLSDDLRQAITAAGLAPSPPSISSDQAMLLSSLQSVRGLDFDKAYARQQELAHAQAVAVEESFADSGLDPNLRKAAQTALPTIRDHLKSAQQLRTDVGAF
jgi:putative membrane protein